MECCRGCGCAGPVVNPSARREGVGGWVLLLPLAVSLSGCMVGPNYHTPNIGVPDAFYSPGDESKTTGASDSQKSRPDIQRWWETFNDPELDSLVDRAIKANFDLEIAFARLQEARAMEAAVAGTALPTAEMSAGAGKGTGTNLTKGRVSAPLNAATNTTGLNQITQVAGFDARWELDFFGKYRREIEAARANTQAAAEIRNDILITLVADVARAYIDGSALQKRLQIALDNVEIERQTVDVVQKRFTIGLINELDLVLAKRQLAALQSKISPLKSQIDASQRRLAVLLGEYPEALTSELAVPKPLPQVPVKIETGLPVDLLRRRPDIREAERELAANTALIGARIADLFPQVSLTAGVGIQGQGPGAAPVNNQFIWSAGPGAYWPILDFGTLDALIAAQKFRAREVLVNYRKTIISAVEEVDNAIDSYSAEQKRLQNLSDVLEASRRAVALAQGRYNRGLTDFLNVTDAERQLYEIADQFTLVQEATVLQYIAVYKGMGVGWEDDQTTPAIHQPKPAAMPALRHLTKG